MNVAIVSAFNCFDIWCTKRKSYSRLKEVKDLSTKGPSDLMIGQNVSFNSLLDKK